MAYAASFELHLRCANCRKDAIRRLDVPAVDDAPSTIDELMESAFLAAQRFTCAKCESPTGTIIGVNKMKEAA